MARHNDFAQTRAAFYYNLKPKTYIFNARDGTGGATVEEVDETGKVKLRVYRLKTERLKSYYVGTEKKYQRRDTLFLYGDRKYTEQQIHDYMKKRGFAKHSSEKTLLRVIQLVNMRRFATLSMKPKPVRKLVVAMLKLHKTADELLNSYNQGMCCMTECAHAPSIVQVKTRGLYFMNIRYGRLSPGLSLVPRRDHCNYGILSRRSFWARYTPAALDAVRCMLRCTVAANSPLSGPRHRVHDAILDLGNCLGVERTMSYVACLVKRAGFRGSSNFIRSRISLETLRRRPDLVEAVLCLASFLKLDDARVASSVAAENIFLARFADEDKAACIPLMAYGALRLRGFCGPPNHLFDKILASYDPKHALFAKLRKYEDFCCAKPWTGCDNAFRCPICQYDEYETFIETSTAAETAEVTANNACGVVMYECGHAVCSDCYPNCLTCCLCSKDVKNAGREVMLNAFLLDNG